MEPSKLETQFKTKLNQREISPSSASWDRLDAMLTVAEEKKPKQKYNWLFIAACILGFLFIGTIFFSQTEELIDVRRKEIVFDSKKDTSINKTNSAIQKNKNEILPISKSQPLVQNNPSKTSKFNQIKVSIINQNNNSKDKNYQNPISTQNPEIIEQGISNNVIASNPEIVTPQSSKENSETNKNAGAKTTTIKVNPMSLLSQVDGELNQSYRETKLEIIKRNFKTVKEALATRNQE